MLLFFTVTMMMEVSVMMFLVSSLKNGSGWYSKEFSSSITLSSWRKALKDWVSEDLFTTGLSNSSTVSFLCTAYWMNWRGGQREIE